MLTQIITAGDDPGYSEAMTFDASPNGGKRDPHGRPHGFRLGSVAGIEIRLDASLIIIFGLLVWLLGGRVFPGWHPQWSPVLNWATASAAGVLFFVSLLLHELAHSLVAKHHAIPVPRITLFMFGGMSEMAHEPRTPAVEFQVAIVGPAVSLMLGLVFLLCAAMLAGPSFTDDLLMDQAAAMSGLSPLTTLLFWLGPVNVILAVFNLVPGFPLDGGRVLRAAIWWFTGDPYRATRTAASAGRLFGWTLVAYGVFQVVAYGLLAGLWLVLIGWFLASAATTGYAQVTIQRALSGHRVKDLMRTHFETVVPEMSVSEFVDDYLLRSAQRLWPVVSGERVVGVVDLEGVREVSHDQRRSLTLDSVMRPNVDSLVVSPDLEAVDAMQILSNSSRPLAVIRDDQVVGLLSQEDIVKWLALRHHEDTALSV